jgi:predicted DNA-binding transcriptional regulator YafY
MNKAERLFSLFTLLRSRRTAMTAQVIANTMRTSVRTVYRDIRALNLLGIPVAGSTGVGYLMNSDHQLPPIMFTADEVLGLMVGARMVQAFTDTQLGRAARSAEQKIRAALPHQLKGLAERQPYRIPVVARDRPLRELHGQLRIACEQRTKIRITYLDEKQVPTERILWPLGMVGWSGCWTLLAWCELRGHYRNFRFDRIEKMIALSDTFPGRPDISLAHYFKTVHQVHDTGW